MGTQDTRAEHYETITTGRYNIVTYRPTHVHVTASHKYYYFFYTISREFIAGRKIKIPNGIVKGSIKSKYVDKRGSSF